jgi:hypothetical protein
MTVSQSERMTLTERSRRTPELAPSDLFAVDDLLSDDERLIRVTVRAFVRERALPVIPGHFESGTFPRKLIPEVALLGVDALILSAAIRHTVEQARTQLGVAGDGSIGPIQGSTP